MALTMCALWSAGSVAFGADPTLTFTARDSVVDKGEPTTLDWSSTSVKRCEASGGWSGSKPLSGSANTGPISEHTAYTLTCSGRNGSMTAMLGVSVNGTVTLSWSPPKERVDGSDFDRPAGFRIYYGSGSRSYTEQVRLTNPDATVWSTSLPSGTYYFAITALDLDGLESSQSNEVTRILE